MQHGKGWRVPVSLCDHLQHEQRLLWPQAYEQLSGRPDACAHGLVD